MSFRRRIAVWGRRSQDGFTAIEMMMVVMILGIAAGSLGAVLSSAQRTQAFAQSESESLDTARTAAGQIQRDVRNALAVATCSPAGYCLEVYTQSKSGFIDQVRYRAVQAAAPSTATTLFRDVGCDPAYTRCAIARPLITNLKNNASAQAVFTCVSSVTFPRVDVILLVAPLAASNRGTLTVQSSARPRNVTTAFC